MNRLRLKRRLKELYPHLGASRVADMIAQGLVVVNGRSGYKKSWVYESDEIVLPEGVDENHLQPNPDLSCQLVKMTKDYIVLNKPAGIHSIALAPSDKNAVANWLLSLDEELCNISSPLESGLMHRLDYETSGLMLAARNKKAYEHFLKQFKQNKIQKEYTCLVSTPLEKIGLFKAYMGQQGKRAKAVRVYSNQNQNKSLRLLKTEVLSQKPKGIFFELRIKLITGARHQIRAHLRHLGCPLVGDDLYKGVVAKRLMLHASALGFEDLTGKERTYFSEADF